MSDFDLFQPSEEHRMLREAARAVAKDKITPHAAEVDETGEFPQAAYDALRAADLHAVHIPEEYDGAGGDALAACIVIDEVARVCAASSLIPAVNKLGTMPLILGAGEEQKQKYLTPVARGDAMFSYGLSEREAGSDTASMRCRARRDGDEWVLDGQKSWITNAGVSEYYTVLAVTDPDGPRGGNVSAFVVEKGDPGFSFGAPERKLGIKGSPTRELLFDGTRIPADRLVGAEGTGLKLALRTLDHTRITIGAQAVGIAQGALDQALAYVKERKQFGRPIGSFQSLRHRLADLATEIETSRLLVYDVARRTDADPRQLLPREASMAKLKATETAKRAALEGMQMMGGYGYATEYDMERHVRTALASTIYGGTSEIQRDIIAKTLGL